MSQQRPSAETAPRVEVLNDRTDDERGASFSVARSYLDHVGAAQDMHVATIEPGHVRGNHYHAERRELIVVMHRDRWSLHWDSGADTETASRTFEGVGAVAIAIPPDTAHAIRNDGAEILWLVAATDGPYDSEARDAYRRIVTPA